MRLNLGRAAATWTERRRSAPRRKLKDKTVNGGVNSVGSVEASHRWELSCTLTTVPVLLTFPPPGTCFILSLEPQRDCTLLKSSFLSRICTWKVDTWGKKTVNQERNVRDARAQREAGRRKWPIKAFLEEPNDRKSAALPVKTT